jgi:hypothetical protein
MLDEQLQQHADQPVEAQLSGDGLERPDHGQQVGVPAWNGGCPVSSR